MMCATSSLTHVRVALPFTLLIDNFYVLQCHLLFLCIDDVEAWKKIVMLTDDKIKNVVTIA
jgi:hypothetical protein